MRVTKIARNMSEARKYRAILWEQGYQVSLKKTMTGSILVYSNKPKDPVTFKPEMDSPNSKLSS